MGAATLEVLVVIPTFPFFKVPDLSMFIHNKAFIYTFLNLIAFPPLFLVFLFFIAFCLKMPVLIYPLIFPSTVNPEIMVFTNDF